MINKFKSKTESINCPNCGVSYILFEDCAKDIPYIHRVCLNCGSPFVAPNPFYIEEVEYVCVEETDVQTSRTSLR